MKILIVKTSSLGDVIHTLPALTDALRAYPDLEVDWLVEKNFSEPLRWHSGVKRIIEIEFRKWRKTPWQAWQQGHWQSVYKQLRQNHYDIIIDAQGLSKSAFMAFVAKGKRHGLAMGSSRDPVAPWLYHHRHVIDWQTHAIERIRQLFSKAFFNPYVSAQSAQYILFLHGTTWDTKLWPLPEWQALGQKLKKAGYQIRLPWGNAIEKERAQAIAKACDGQVLPPLNLREIALELINAQAVVAVDTGLGHLAQARAASVNSI
jgi:heptosyltransferase-1